MGDYIYGRYLGDTKELELSTEYTEQGARTWGQQAIRIPVSAIEPLPEPKPVLPTTPGSVVRVDGLPYMRVSDEWWQSEDIGIYSNELADVDYEVLFDAGAHYEPKTNE